MTKPAIANGEPRIVESLRNGIMKEFAREMEYGMVSYEALMTNRKRALFGNVAEGSTVVDIGIGTGPNMKYLPHDVNLIGVEPNKFMWPFAEERARSLGIRLSLKEGNGERLPLEDESCDFAITTLTLCSVKDPSLTVREILRVLKPGGKHLFIEHVVANENRPLLRGAQNLLTPLQVALADGCHLNRDTLAYLNSAKDTGFSRVSYEEFDAKFDTLEDWISPIRPHIAGFAVKSFE
ncbi:Methyltransferase-like protein 7A [Gracilariopsis chorda]|uniref:Methyltransferase-like protein 7A n=1 Tax=Gracilariopsis chorda TaxID=448386 RepID=A0A2V3J3U6_9FLOR|nr:Methyltransferase-like protein 7A [Gracilariopsis chorda]|eukprot:PXF49065.1 Methyltransferase-like protein 7A [Gracilariopsis chorda]